jgi:adenylate cyclase class 2
VYEVELKVRADHERVREVLAARGAELDHEVRQVDTYYDAPHREFAETDEALRIRRQTDLESGYEETELTYKGPLVEAASKTREEHETLVGDPAGAEGILDGLGFEPAATVEKRRKAFSLGGYTVTLDAVEGLGEFVEVERAVAADDADDPGVARVREGAIDLLDELGLDHEEQIRTSYLGLLLDAEGAEK